MKSSRLRSNGQPSKIIPPRSYKIKKIRFFIRVFACESVSSAYHFTKKIKNKDHKKSPTLLWDFLYLDKLKNYFFSVFSILAFNAANTSLLSPKVAAGAFVEELDEVFSVAAFTFFSSSSRKIAV